MTRRMIPVFLLIIFSIYVLYDRLLLNHISQKELKSNNIYTFLFLKTRRKKIDNATIMLLLPEKRYIHFISLHKDLYDQISGKKIFHKKKTGFIRRKLKEIYGLNIKYVVEVNEKTKKSILSKSGITPYFNNDTDALEAGTVYINENNYNTFLSNIFYDNKETDRERILIDNSFSLWYNILLHHFKYINKYKDYQTVKIFTKGVKTILFPKRDLVNLLKWGARNYNNFYTSYHRISTFKDDNGNVLPVQKGQYDYDKITAIINDFKNTEYHLKAFPITLQIANTTKISRLAAKTSGVLRMKKCNAQEWINFKKELKHSVIIDRCGHAVKRRYLMRITKISNVIYKTDYRRKYDFSVYLGNDYYAIRYFTND